MPAVPDGAALLQIRAELLARWQLTPGQLFQSPLGNLVLAVSCVDGSAAVLKISGAGRETRSEISALRIWDGHGAARLLASDAENAALLLERVEPGRMLADAAMDDDAATLIAVHLLRQLWRAPPADHELRPLESWCGAFERNRAPIVERRTSFPIKLFQRADGTRADLLASTTEDVVLHGDLHHYNVLGAARAGWLAIDPKGLLGDRAFDVCQFLRNPVEVSVEVNRRRLDIFCTELALDPQRTRAWCLVHAVLDALWELEKGRPIDDALAYVEQTLAF